jgi:hypothetical protein
MENQSRFFVSATRTILALLTSGLFLYSGSHCEPLVADGCRTISPSLEAGHILNCQDPASGAINDIHGAPTYVKPGEMAMAAVALKLTGHGAEALKACVYLASVQQADGSWCNQYDHQTIADPGKSPRHTAQTLMAFRQCGYVDTAVTDKALGYLAECITHSCDPANGCLGGGRDSAGNWIGTQWLSDNVFAAHAFEYYGDNARAAAIKTAIDVVFQDTARGCWFQTRSGGPGNYVMTAGDFGWINFAPANWNLQGVTYPAGLAATIKSRLQTADGAFLENEKSDKRMPGIGLQAHLALRAAGSSDPLAGFYTWLKCQSGLLQNAPDANDDAGGVIDWVDSAGNRADWWNRFIDTSAYVIFLEKNFNF